MSTFGNPFDLIEKAMDKIWPDKNERLKAQAALDQAKQAGDLREIEFEWENARQQLEVAKIEATSPSLLVSGGRPFVIWVCGVSLAYAGILEPILRFVASVFFGYSGEFPELNTVITGQLLAGVLGLGGYRMIEKMKGVASK